MMGGNQEVEYLLFNIKWNVMCYECSYVYVHKWETDCHQVPDVVAEMQKYIDILSLMCVLPNTWFVNGILKSQRTSKVRLY